MSRPWPRRRRAWAWTLVVLVVVAAVGGWWLRRFAMPPGEAYLRAASDVDVHFTPVASGFTLPVYATTAKDGTDTLYVVEKAGLVYRVEGGQTDPDTAPELFLDLSEQVMIDTWERGLYSIAFHPNYPTDPRLYVAYTAKPDGRMVVAEHRLDAATGMASAEASRSILELAKPTYPNGEPIDSHNGGQLQFGPNDGYLYISLGDGTRPSLTNFDAQDLGDLWGSLLRVDIDGGDPYAVPDDNPFLATPGARPEIWAYGLRNPWRFDFDPDGSTIWLADVGQSTYEEIDRVLPGRNYGWPIREGRLWSWRNNLKAMGVTKSTWYQWGHIAAATRTYASTVGRRLTPPVVDYGQVSIDPAGGQTVVVGQIYRGQQVPGLKGRLLFGDFITGRLWSLEFPTDGLPVRRELLDSDHVISSFAEDTHGEVYITDYDRGMLFRLEPGPSAGA